MNDTADNGLLANVKRDIITLAQALNQLNNYGARIPTVSAACASILAPSPSEARAQEDLALLAARRPKLGTLSSIIADWDAEWHFVFVFRFSEGYVTADGFDLRPADTGYAALKRALDICGVSEALCDLSEPTPAGAIPERRLIFPSAPKPAVTGPEEAPKAA